MQILEKIVYWKKTGKVYTRGTGTICQMRRNKVTYGLQTVGSPAGSVVLLRLQGSGFGGSKQTKFVARVLPKMIGNNFMRGHEPSGRRPFEH